MTGSLEDAVESEVAKQGRGRTPQVSGIVSLATAALASLTPFSPAEAQTPEGRQQGQIIPDSVAVCVHDSPTTPEPEYCIQGRQNIQGDTIDLEPGQGIVVVPQIFDVGADREILTFLPYHLGLNRYFRARTPSPCWNGQRNINVNNLVLPGYLFPDSEDFRRLSADSMEIGETYLIRLDVEFRRDDGTPNCWPEDIIDFYIRLIEASLPEDQRQIVEKVLEKEGKGKPPRPDRGRGERPPKIPEVEGPPANVFSALGLYLAPAGGGNAQSFETDPPFDLKNVNGIFGEYATDRGLPGGLRIGGNALFMDWDFKDIADLVNNIVLRTDADLNFFGSNLGLHLDYVHGDVGEGSELVNSVRRLGLGFSANSGFGTPNYFAVSLNGYADLLPNDDLASEGRKNLGAGMELKGGVRWKRLQLLGNAEGGLLFHGTDQEWVGAPDIEFKSGHFLYLDASAHLQLAGPLYLMGGASWSDRIETVNISGEEREGSSNFALFYVGGSLLTR